MAFKGVDVSYYQGNIDWDAVRQDGIDFAILRAGYGQNNIDDKFHQYAQECTRLGIPFGVYWFSYAYNVERAVREAQYCLQAVAPYRLSYPIAFDFEYDSVRYAKDKGVSVGKSLASDMARAFLNEIESAGHYAILYANADYLTNYFESDMPSRYDVWYAQWPSKVPDPENKPANAGGMWQYTSSGSVNGISGRVDMNYAYKDYPSLIGYRPTPAPIPEPEQPSGSIDGGIDMADYEQFKSFMERYEKEKGQLPVSSWFVTETNWAIDNGLIQGSNTGYNWQTDITREQFIAVLFRYHNRFNK